MQKIVLSPPYFLTVAIVRHEAVSGQIIIGSKKWGEGKH